MLDELYKYPEDMIHDWQPEYFDITFANGMELKHVRYDGCQYFVSGNITDHVFRNETREVHFKNMITNSEYTENNMYVPFMEYRKEQDETAFNLTQRTYQELEMIEIKASIDWIQMNTLNDIMPINTRIAGDNKYFERFKLNYNTGIWDTTQLRVGVEKHYITAMEYEQITGEVYTY